MAAMAMAIFRTLPWHRNSGLLLIPLLLLLLLLLSERSKMAACRCGQAATAATGEAEIDTC